MMDLLGFILVFSMAMLMTPLVLGLFKLMLPPSSFRCYRKWYGGKWEMDCCGDWLPEQKTEDWSKVKRAGKP